MVNENWCLILFIMGMIRMKSILMENVTDTPEFKRWFGNSKVVDKHGNPLVVYHGTKSDISTFDIEKSPNGFFFTPYSDLAGCHGQWVGTRWPCEFTGGAPSRETCLAGPLPR